MSNSYDAKLRAFAKKIGYKHEGPAMLKEALTHRTFAHESKDELTDNQRLEFLGDAVVGLSIADHLMRNFPQLDEGQLSQRRAQLINAKTLAQCANDLGVNEVLLIGKGEKNMGPSAEIARLSDAFEAIVGALYLDLGFIYVHQWVWDVLHVYLQDTTTLSSPKITAKTRLQLWAHQQHLPSPVYIHVHQSVSEQVFTAQVKIADYLGSIGTGHSKRQAEQQAAELTLQALETEEISIFTIKAQSQADKVQNKTQSTRKKKIKNKSRTKNRNQNKNKESQNRSQSKSKSKKKSQVKNKSQANNTSSRTIKK